jgi:hypothetical protein
MSLDASGPGSARWVSEVIHGLRSGRRGATSSDARAVWQWRYVLTVSDTDPKTEELKLSQLERERAERERAETAPDEDEAVQHERRADKARYLAEKLEERAESERRQDD